MMNHTPTSHRKLYALDQPIESFFHIDNRYDATIYWKDNDGLFLGCNDFQTSLFNANLSDIFEKNDEDFFAKKNADIIRNNDSSVISDQLTHVFIESAKDKLNRRYSGLSFKTPLKDSAKNRIGIFGISFILNDSFKLDLNLIKPFIQNNNSFNLIQAYPALILLLKNNITKREAETLYYFMRCKTIKEMARQMGNLSPKTIEEYLDKCRKKLNAKTSNEMLSLLWDTNFAYLTQANIQELFL